MQININYVSRLPGKKTHLVGWVRGGARRILLTATIEECRRLRDEFPQLASRIFHWKELSMVHRDTYEEIAMEDAEKVLQEFFGSRLVRITINK